MDVLQFGAAAARGAARAASGQRDHRQYRARQRAIDRRCHRALPSRSGEYGGRGVHERLPDQQRDLRPGSRRLEHRRTSQSGCLAGGGSPRAAGGDDAAHPRRDMKLSLGFSPCPNDCFMFDAIVNRRIDTEGLEFAVHLADVEHLNDAALAGQAQVTKLSYHAYAHCTDRYVLLDAGSALGRNCGPLLISKRAISDEEVAAGALRIAIPGKLTTANLLLGLAFPRARNTTELVFS